MGVDHENTSGAACACMQAYIWSSGSKLCSLLFLSFLSYNHLRYLPPPIQNNMVSFIMHPRFIFLFLLHKIVANQELPLSRTSNLFPPAPDLLPATAVSSIESTSAAASGSASQAFETRDGNGKYVHHQKRQKAPFPIEPSYRLIFNDGVFDSVPNNGFPRSGYVNLLPRDGRGNALEIDTMGVVRIGKQLGLSIVDAVPAFPGGIGPDNRDPARNARPEEKRSLGRGCDHPHYPGANRRRDLYHRNRPSPTDSNRVGCRAAVGARDNYPMSHSNNQMSPRPTGISSGEDEGISRRSISSIPPYLDRNRFRNLAPLDGENVSEDVDRLRVRKRGDGGGHNSGTNLGNEYSLFTSDSIFGPAAKGSTGPVTTRSESEMKEGPDKKESFHESVPTFGSPRTGDPPIVLPKNVIRGVSSAGIACDEIYKLQRGDDGAMRSVLVKRLDDNPGIQPEIGRPILFVEISHDGKVYIASTTSPTKGTQEVEVQYTLPI